VSKSDDRAWADYSQDFRDRVLPKLLDSAVFLSIGSEVGEFDVRQATEIGAALVFDKPILIVVPKGRNIGMRMRRAADVVVDDWDAHDPASQARMVAAIKQLNQS
jgi:hypothetical protein